MLFSRKPLTFSYYSLYKRHKICVSSNTIRIWFHFCSGCGNW